MLVNKIQVTLFYPTISIMVVPNINEPTHLKYNENTFYLEGKFIAMVNSE